MTPRELAHRGRVRKALEENDPPVVPGQRWIVKNEAGEVMRRLLILAEYPTDIGRRAINSWEGKLWIFEECHAKMKVEVGRINTCPKFNLRYVFELEE